MYYSRVSTGYYISWWGNRDWMVGWPKKEKKKEEEEEEDSTTLKKNDSTNSPKFSFVYCPSIANFLICPMEALLGSIFCIWCLSDKNTMMWCFKINYGDMVLLLHNPPEIKQDLVVSKSYQYVVGLCDNNIVSMSPLTLKTLPNVIIVSKPYQMLEGF